MTTPRAAFRWPGLPGATASAARPPLQLHGRWLWLGRVVWALYAVVAVGLAIFHLPTDLTSPAAFRGIGAPHSALLHEGLQSLGLNPAIYAGYRVVLDHLAALVGLVAAALLMRRKSSEVVVLLIALQLTAGVAFLDPPSLIALEATHPLQATLGKVMTITRMTLLLALFFVFPDGRFVPRWGIVPVSIWFAQLVGIMFFPGTVVDTWDWPPLPTALGFALLFGPAIYAQVDRYRRLSGPVERQQAKWAIGGVVVAVIAFVGLNVWLAAQENRLDDSPVRAVLSDFAFNTVFTLAFAAIPIALAIAVLKHRLFAIDVIINRALVYGGLTVGVVALYVLVVVGVGALFRVGDNLVVSLVATALVAVLFQPLRDRLQRGSNRLLYGERDEPYTVISRLGQRLEGTLPTDAILPTIVETVAGALRLPHVAITLGGDGERAVAAATGTPTHDPLRLPLTYHGEVVGELLLARRAPGEDFSPADHRLLADLARQAGVAARAVRLADEARVLAADLQASRERLVTAREEERRRLRRDLHDGLGPRLAALTLRLETARDLLKDDPRADALLADLARRTEEAVADIRRLVYALRPPALDDLGLIGALRQAAEGYGSAGPEITVETGDADGRDMARLPAAVEVAAYRIALEALTNVVRHAAARGCTIRLHLDARDGMLVVEVTDDGRGIAPGQTAGIGLASMRERAAELGGTCVVEAPPAGGTRVCARLPCRPTAGDEREGAAW
jgi:signal transduction histidine kinase